MTDISSAELEMSILEQQLKSITESNPYTAKTIMTSQELNDYQRWMYESFASTAQPLYPVDDVYRFPNISKKADVLNHIHLAASGKSQLMPFRIHSSMSESEEILANHDIAVGRMLRYFPAHWHSNDYFEIYYALSGACPIHFQNEVITVKPGTVLIIAPSVVHATPCYGDDQVLLYYTIRSSTFDQVFWNQLPSDNLMSTFFRQALSSQHSTAYLHFETGEDRDIRFCLYQIYREYCTAERYSAQMLNALMSAFFVLLLRRYEGTARLPRRSDFFWKHEFSAILTYIQTNFATTGIKDVARQFHYSDRQIGRIVQNCTGLTFAELVLKLRMEQAGKLLHQGVSPDAVSGALGYSAPSSFFRAFAKYHGCTPREFARR